MCIINLHQKWTSQMYIPMDSGIIFFSGFGVIFIFSTMLRIGFTEFIDKLDGLTFHEVPLLTFILTLYLNGDGVVGDGSGYLNVTRTRINRFVLECSLDFELLALIRVAWMAIYRFERGTRSARGGL